MRFTPRILELAQAGAATGEPILRPLAYGFPDGGYANVKDQFLMGDDLLVFPMVTQGTARTVRIPSGTWKADDGVVVTGPIQDLRCPPRSPALLRATVTPMNTNSTTATVHAKSGR